MYTLSRKFSFESAHRLAKGYVGKCANIHGHSFQGELVVTCDTVDKYGIGIDYSELKKFVKQIEAQLDHTLLLYEGDGSLIEMCKKIQIEFKTFTDNPTSETLARYIFESATHYFEEEFPTVSVREVAIEETCMCRCSYRA